MILVTGASGFIGNRLLKYLSKQGATVSAFARAPLENIETRIGDLSDCDSLRAACSGVHTVYHCAGYAHAFKSATASEGVMHWTVNYDGTRNLVEVAASAGVRVFVFLSSVKAMAEPGAICADESWQGVPNSDYGRAKLAAEVAVLEMGQRFGMHVTNLRLPMVYGSGGRGNLERMARMVDRSWFPPLPETGNHRSLVHVDDVLAAMCLVASNSKANGKTYIITSPEAPSGRQLFDGLRSALGKSVCGWAVPEGWFRLAARCGDGLGALTGRRLPLNSEVLYRLLSSAWYSSALIERELGWRAQIGLEKGLRELVGI